MGMDHVVFADRSLAQLSFERLHPALTETDAETQSQTINIAIEELGEGLKSSKGIGTLQEDQESQLTWTLRGSQRINHQPMSKLRLVTFLASVQLGLHVSPPSN